MPRPKLEPHLRRLLIDEQIFILSLFTTKQGPYFCSLVAPVEDISDALLEGQCYATGQGDIPEDAVYAARQKLWNGL